MLGPDDLVLCTGTLRDAPIRDKIAAAAASGFRGISLWPDDVERARAAGLEPRDIRTLLDDHGLEVAELDPLLTWYADPEALAPDVRAGIDEGLDRGEATFHAMASEIGGRVINCAHPFPGEVDLDRAAERFAGVCDRAREHDLAAAIEFLPWTGIPDAATAAEIVRRAGRSNGGILFDSWHHHRGPGDDESLRAIPGALVLGVQLNGALPRPDGPVMVETMHRRLLPDEGAIDVAQLVRSLDAIGSRAPLGVEVFSDALDALGPAEAAARCRTAMDRVLSRARGDREHRTP